MNIGRASIALAALVASCGLFDQQKTDGEGPVVLGPGDDSGAGDAGDSGSEAGSSGGAGDASEAPGEDAVEQPVEVECNEIIEIATLDDFAVVNAVAGVGSVSGAPVEGFGEGHHLLMVEFYQFGGPQTAGSFDLSDAPNNNYETCDNCIRVLVDIGDSGPATQFFPSSGNVNIEVPDEEGTGQSKGSLTDVTLFEVAIDPYTYRSEPINTGRCVHVSEIAWDLLQ